MTDVTVTFITKTRIYIAPGSPLLSSRTIKSVIPTRMGETPDIHITHRYALPVYNEVQEPMTVPLFDQVHKLVLYTLAIPQLRHIVSYGVDRVDLTLHNFAIDVN
jgi:hypothetical protein